MDGWLFYTILDLLPSIFMLLFVVIAGLVRFLLHNTEFSSSKPSRSWLKRADTFLKNRSRLFFHSSCGALGRNLKDDEDLVADGGVLVHPKVYQSVSLYILMMPFCAFLLSLNSMILQELNSCSDSSDCFFSKSDFFLGQQVSNCSSLQDTDEVICYKIVLNFWKGLSKFGGLMVTLYLFMRASSAIIQVFHPYVGTLRAVSYVMLVLFSAGMAVVIQIGSVHLSKELPHFFVFFSISALALSIPWELVSNAQYVNVGSRLSTRSGSTSVEGERENEEELIVCDQKESIKSPAEHENTVTEEKAVRVDSKDREEDKPIEITASISTQDTDDTDGPSGSLPKEGETNGDEKGNVKVSGNHEDKDEENSVLNGDDPSYDSTSLTGISSTDSDSGSILAPEDRLSASLSISNGALTKKRKNKNSLRKWDSLETTV